MYSIRGDKLIMNNNELNNSVDFNEEYQEIYLELEELKHLLNILQNDYFINLGSFSSCKESINTMDSSLYIDFLTNKEQYETLLTTSIRKLNEILNRQNKIFNKLKSEVH